MIYLKDVENVVIEGGGIRTLALLGVIKFLEEKNVLHKIKRVIGSSGGSLYALLVTLKVSYKDALEVVETFDFTKLKDDSKWTGYLGDAYSMYKNYSICSGDQLTIFYQSLLEKFAGDKNITFSQLYAKSHIQLVVTGTNLNLMKTEYFSHITEPDMPIYLACRISSSIPFFFKSPEYKGNLYVDGGVLNNYPIWYFDTCNGDKREVLPSYSKTNTYEDLLENYYKIKTIGFKLVSADEKMGNSVDEKIEYTRRDIKSVKDFTLALADTLTLQVERSQIHKDYFKHTIKISTGNVSSTDFGISLETKEMLIKSGYDACKNGLI